MRKLLVALMIVAFAATAFATDIKFSGTYEVSGKYLKNTEAREDDTLEHRFYEHDFDLWLKADVDKDTFFKAKFEILDDTWQGSPGNDTGYGNQTQFSVQRAWMGHNFGSVLLEVGLMDGGAWSYAFGNNKEGHYRIKATVPVSNGRVSFYTQKSKETEDLGFDDTTDTYTGSAYVEDQQKDDNDAYAINYVGKFNGITVAPLLVYKNNSYKVADQGSDGEKIWSLDLAVGGDLGPVGFEFEFDYDNASADFDYAVGEDSYDVFGIYGNVFTKVGGATVGFITAYSSFDKDAGVAYDMADDFDDDLLFILGDEGYLSSAIGAAGVALNGSYSGLAAIWANGIYAAYDVNEKLNITGGFFYAMSTAEDTAVEDATGYEFDLIGSYAVTDALSYKVQLGYASVDPDVSGVDPDPAMALFHTLSLSF
ncbi:hypothetical protein ACMC5R_05890 [Deferribacteres bacterium DY0037]